MTVAGVIVIALVGLAALARLAFILAPDGARRALCCIGYHEGAIHAGAFRCSFCPHAVSLGGREFEQGDTSDPSIREKP